MKRVDSLALCAALIKYLNECNISPVFVGAAPASTRGVYYVLADVESDFTQEDLIATDGAYSEFDVSVYGDRLIDVDAAAARLWAVMNRPGEVFSMGDMRVDYCRVQRDSLVSVTTPQGAENSQIFYQLTALVKTTKRGAK